jgi:hypothetical protein|tara:strand:+ start:51 stop:242 length:192 start_codon:yes stop_codon:yes gene_type:complete
MPKGRTSKQGNTATIRSDNTNNYEDSLNGRMEALMLRWAEREKRERIIANIIKYKEAQNKEQN